MSHLFVAHSSDDATEVESITRAIENHGYRCWFYERDAKPGDSYLEAEGKAITDATVVLFIATQSSVTSFEVKKELQYAHKREKQLFTVVVDRVSMQLMNDSYEFGMLLGTSIQLNLENRDPDSCADDIVEKLKKWDMPRWTPDPPSEPDRPPPPQTKMHWVSDGMQVEIESLPSFVFVTRTVKQFMEGSQYFFVCANKGLGKTLLLRYKRSQIQAEKTKEATSESAENRGLVMIPEDRPFLDQLSDLPTMSKEKRKDFLANLRNSRRLWSFAIRLSVISHCPYVFDKVAKGLQKSLPKNWIDWISDRGVSPTQIYRHLLAQGQGEVHKLLDSTESSIDTMYRAVHNGVRIFVDRVDESTSELDKDEWINLQAGLIEASWTCMNANNHVKIYASIREEAYVNYESATKPNLHGAVVTLRYSHDELRQMIEQLSTIYEQGTTFTDFIGLRDVSNNHAGVVEDSFDYLHRHTLGRPRDLVIVCAEISRRGICGNEKLFRETVKQVGSDLVNSTLFNEMSVFLNCLRSSASRERFFSRIPYNVLTREELVTICCEFNDIDVGDFGDLHAVGNVLQHPFCELWSCGLLGIVQNDESEDTLKQRFKQRYDRVEHAPNSLPTADFYLIHPSLQASIHRCRDGAGYNVFSSIVVGHGNPWLAHFNKLVNYQRCVFQVADDEIRREANQLLPFMYACRHPDRNIRQFAAESIEREIEALIPRLEKAGLEELSFALDECVADEGS